MALARNNRFGSLSLALALFVGGCSGGWVVPNDTDGDGYSAEEGDCDNNNPLIYPGAEELCDGLDNNCDGLSEVDGDQDGFLTCEGCQGDVGCGDCDDALPQTHPGAEELCDDLDNNCDGEGDVDNDGDGACQPNDCDDNNAWVFPGAPERCNNADDDCDGAIEAPGLDQDNDGWAVCGAPGGTAISDDCDDGDPTIHPLAPEQCNGKDDDCDGLADDPEGAFDHDGDKTSDCIDNDLDGLTEQEGDCDDLDRNTAPGAPEYLDERDNDCDGAIDEDISGDDADGDGYSAQAGDCDDTDDSLYPGASERCDGVDQDCDHEIDEGLVLPYWRDGDGDGYGTGSPTRTCEPRGTGWATAGGDCDDQDAAIHPAAPEICNDVDDNCDGQIDEWPDEAVTWYLDGDGDGFGLTHAALDSGCQAPTGYAISPGDCDDAEFQANPGHPEWCGDGLDNDCDGTTDETGATTRVGEEAARLQWMEEDTMQWRIALAVALLGSAPAIMGVEGCCEATTYYYDADGDGYGDPGDTIQSCEQPQGYVDNGDDCDDLDPRTNPAAEEVCDRLDNDCDGEVDEDCTDDEQALCERTGGEWTHGCSPVTCENPGGDDGIDCLVAVPLCECPADTPYWDEDRGCISLDECDVPVDQDGDGYSLQRGDCDDTNPRIHPGAEEICDGLDNDCDGRADEDCPDDTRLCEATGGEWDTCGSSCGPLGCPGLPVPAYPCTDECKAQCVCPDDAPYWVDGLGCVNERECPDNLDNDGDGFTEAQGDCDDDNPRVNPRAEEVCDGLDNNCDGRIDNVEGTVYYVDNDLDGYGGEEVVIAACGDEDPAPYPDNLVRIGGDCDDNNPRIHPGAEEICDGLDNDCDGRIDNVDGTTYYFDNDQDGYGGEVFSVESSCNSADPIPFPGDIVTIGGDCDDTDPRINPGAEEICDGIDNNCNDFVDERCNECYFDDAGTYWCPCDDPTARADLYIPAPAYCECDPETGECPPSGNPLCERTGGDWNDCGSGCGPATCDNPQPGEVCPDVCVAQCECPADAPLWDEDKGCVSRDECAPSAEERLCDNTGGHWGEGCGQATCTDPNAPITTTCVTLSPMCICPAEAPYWDAEQGCIAVDECRRGPSVLCGDTGGDWTQGCFQTTCDAADPPTGGDCASDYWICQCNREAPYWTDDLGCVTAEECRR